MSEKDLIKELQSLPCEIEAKDQWLQIKQAIEGQPVTEIVDLPKKRNWKFPVSIAASFFAVALLAVFIPKQPNVSELNLTQQRTLQSLQQANSQYYSVLGSMMEQEAMQMPSGLSVTLKDLRSAQKSYRMELAANPTNAQVYKKLIKSYHTERNLLRRLMAEFKKD